MSGLRPGIWSHFKKAFCHTHVRSLGRTTNTEYICKLTGRHWTRIYFSRPCGSVDGSGRVYPGSSCSRPRPSDMDSGKPAIMSRAPWLALLEPQEGEASSQALTFLRGARFIAWRLKCPIFRRMLTGLEAFFCSPGVSGLRSCAWNHLKRFCATLGLSPGA